MGMRIAALAMLFGLPLSAQVQGTISGYVKDATGAVVPAAAIRITNEKTGAARTTVSDNEGFYQVLGLLSGSYAVEAEARGFKKYRNAGVTLRVDENVRATSPSMSGR